MLGQQAFGDPYILYKFRGKVEVPLLDMMDEIITAGKCETQVVTSNAAVDTLIKLKLQLSETNVQNYILINTSKLVSYFYSMKKKTSLAGAVPQSPPSLIHSFNDSFIHSLVQISSKH